MKRLARIGVFLALAAVICLPGVAGADIINFDDLIVPAVAVGQPAQVLPADYQGFNWTATTNDYWGVISWGTLANYGNTYQFPSMSNAVTNEGGHNYNYGGLMTFVSSTPFIFNGADFGTWTQNDVTRYFGATSLTINGYLNNILVGTTIFSLSPGAFTPQVGMSAMVDRLEFIPTSASDGGRYFLMDNFNYTPVPLPPSVLLLGSGLVGLLLYRRQRHTAKS